MSTLSGIASKGEKGRPKFQSLDINNLYRGESLEPSQQKNTLPRRHGMQCLGKVPSARRPPANLPSLKSEHSGNDPAVSLVPSGGTGWGSKPGETTGPAATTSQPHTTPPAASIPVVAPQPPVVAPVIPGAVSATPSPVNPPAPSQGPPPVMQQTVHSDKLWSTVMASPGEGGVHPPSFLAHQSPQFQQEFPKLSSGDGQAPATGQKGGSDTQYGPGPSLRPQTEGSWIQGGGRNAGQPPNQMPTGGASGSHQGAAAVPGPLPHIPPGSDPTGGRSNLVPCVAPVGGMGPGGPATQVPNTGGTNVLPGVAPGGNMIPHMAPNAQQQFSRNIMSQFQMYRGAFSPNFQGPMHGPVRPSRYQYPTENRFMARPAPNTVDDELVPRPIIKEEELSKMDDIARDAGWAIHDDDIVDYNQQLLFSDDESTPEEEARKDIKASNKDEKRSNERERERENERESNERDEHREDHRDKRNEPLSQRGPPEQPSRNWQPGRPSVNMDFRSPAGHGPVAPAAHPLPHGGPGPASLDCPMPPVMRPVSHQGQGPGPHGVEDEDIWDERRRQQNVEVAMAIERAKQRKEEEEKRFQGTKQGAARKLQALEQKMKLAAEKEHLEESSTPGPDWEKDKERDSRERDRSRTSSEGREDKGAREPRDSRDNRDHRERDSDFRPIPQIGERPAFMRGERELPRSERDREIPRSERDRERDRDMSRNERGRDIPRNERDIPRNEREREVSRNEREREIPRNERERELPRSERDREIPRNEREREIPRSERDREIPRSERDRDIPRSERDRDIPRSERERDVPRNERERDIPRNERERDIPRSERERDIPRSERDRDIPRSERDREIPRSERDREIPRSERDREIPRNDRDREISRGDREREITRNERERENTRNERDGEITRNDRDREIPRNVREREIRGDRDRDIGRNDRDRDIPRNERERDIPRNERDRDGSRNERDRDTTRNEREREMPRSERDRERDIRSERDRDRDIRSDRDRKPRDSRDRHDGRYLANLPPRFQRSGIDRSGGFYGGQGNQSVPPQPAVGSGAAQGPPTASQGVFPQGSASTQVFDPRWNPPHFPSSPLQAPGPANSSMKSGYMLPRGRDGDASNSDRERERERNERERERELDDRERERERPPSRDPRDRRDRHISDIPERYRPNARERDVRSYPDNGIGARKPSGNYYEGPPEYGRSYSRGSQEYDRNEYGRGREREADVDSRSSESRERETRLGNREGRDREGRHYDDRRDGDLMDDVYDRHPPPQQTQFEDHKRDPVCDLSRQDSSNDWREKDRKLLDDREKLERRDGDVRREREERPQRPDSRDSRTSRESRNSRDSVREERSVHENDHKHNISNREVTGSWVEDHYPEIKEEKKKDFFREERRDVRHPPGPITREKLEASELRSDSKRNLTPLKRSTSLNCSEKKQDVRKADVQTPAEKSDRKPNETDVWNRNATKPLERPISDTTTTTTTTNTTTTTAAAAAAIVATTSNTTSQTRFPEQPSSKPWADQIPSDDSTAPPSAVVAEEKPNVPIDSIKKDVEKDISNSVVVVDDQPGVTLEEERFTFDDADNGFQEVRNKKKEARQKDEQKVQQQPQLQQQQQQSQPQPQLQQQTQPQQPPSTAQSSQQAQGASQQPPMPQRSSGMRDKEGGGRQKGNKQGSNSGSGQIPSPIPGTTQQIPQNPIPQAPVPPNISQGLGGNTKSFDRQRNKLPPRLARQRETSRIQKQQQQQQQQQQYVSVHNDVSEMNKINQSVSIFPIKESPNPAPPPTVNAWDKPINAALRPNSPSANAGSSAIQISGTIANSTENCNLEISEQGQSGASSQRSTPSGDKVSGKLGREVAEKTVLDGTSPPVQTIIFENTNYKSGPSELGMKAAKFSNHLKNSRIDKGRERKLGEDVEDVQLSFANKNSGPVPEMNKTSENKTEPIQMPIAFNKNEDSVDMKLDFTFDSELSQLTDDKKNKSMGLPRSMHLPQGVQSTISHGSTDELNFKIASVKKVWEIIPPGPPVIEHNEDGSVASTASSFTPTFGNPVDSGLEPSFSKVEGSSVTGDDGSALNPGEVVYSSGPQIQNNPNSYSGNVAVSAVPNMVKNDVPSTSSNVCKVKPQQQAVMSAGPSPIGHPGPLSPPPFNSSNTQQGHINYQPTLGGTAAPFGSISAIPSPPTVLSYSSQQIPSQGGLYGAFQLDGSQVRSGQALSQFSGFPPYGLNQGLAGQTSAFNQQSMYLPTAPHPPPSAAPDLYPSSLSQYRIPAAQGPFGQSQQLSSNPSTVLISSTSNSLMSASVKPSSQQIGAIGTKGGGPYQQSGLPSQPSQLYIQYDPSYLSGSQMVQRPGPVQSNVVPTIPHSSSFYSGSAGGQAGFYQATNSTLQQGPSGQPLHQTGSPYGLQGYSTQSGTATPVGLQGFSSQMPQYRGTSLPGHTFLKSGQHPTDHSAGSNGRTQLKSPSSSQQDVLASVSVFSSGPQIPSPKSRSSKQQGPQQQQQQQSPNQQQPSQQNQQQPPHHKFPPYQGMTASTQLAFQQSVRGQMNITVRGGVPAATQRYPQPIQRPVPFPGGGTQSANAMGGRHRPQHQQPSRQPANVNKPGNSQPYYSHGSNVKMENVSDGKPETAGENKITENVTVSGSNNTAPGSSKPVTSVASQPEHKISPAENGKEESAAPAAE